MKIKKLYVDIYKSAWVNVQQVEVGSIYYIQTIGKNSSQDSVGTKIVDISDKEFERISSNSGPIVIVEIASIDTANRRNHLVSTNTNSISSPVFETKLTSIVSNVVNTNLHENTKFMSHTKIYRMPKYSEDTTNGIENTHVHFSSVDVAGDVPKTLDSHIVLITGDDPFTQVALAIGIRHLASDQSMLDVKKLILSLSRMLSQQ